MIQNGNSLRETGEKIKGDMKIEEKVITGKKKGVRKRTEPWVKKAELKISQSSRLKMFLSRS